MPISQICYTRLGAKGEGAGWQIAGKSPNLTERVCNDFENIQAIDMEAFLNQDKIIDGRLGIVTTAERTYFIKYKHLGIGEDNRPYGMSHAFVFNHNEINKLLRTPKNFLQYDGFLEIIPHEAPNKIFDEMNAFDYCDEKPVINIEFAPQLIRCVFTQLYRNETLCIIPYENDMRDQIDWVGISRQYITEIMKHIPFSLRYKLTFSSFYLPKQIPTVVSFSKDEQNCRFNCTTGGYALPSKVNLVTNPLVDYCCNVNNDSAKFELFKEIDNFVNDGGNKYSESMEMLLLAFYSTHYKYNDKKDIRDRDDELGLKLSEQEIIQNLALSIIIRKEKPSESITKLIGRFFYLCINKRIVLPENVLEELKAIQDYSVIYDAYNIYFVESIKPDELSVIEELKNFEFKTPARYNKVIDILAEKRPDVLSKYYNHQIRETSLDASKNYIKNAKKYNVFNVEMANNIAEKILQIYEEKLKFEHHSDTFLNLSKKYDTYLSEVYDGLNKSASFDLTQYYISFQEIFWQYFNWNDFNLININDYNEYTENFTSKDYPDNIKKSETIQTIHHFVSELCTSNYSNGTDNFQKLYEILTTDFYIQELKVRDKIIEQLLNFARQKNDIRKISFDSWILLNYSNTKKQVNITLLFDILERKNLLKEFINDNNCDKIITAIFIDKFKLTESLRYFAEKKYKKGNKNLQVYYQKLYRSLGGKGKEKVDKSFIKNPDDSTDNQKNRKKENKPFFKNLINNPRLLLFIILAIIIPAFFLIIKYLFPLLSEEFKYTDMSGYQNTESTDQSSAPDSHHSSETSEAANTTDIITDSIEPESQPSFESEEDPDITENTIPPSVDFFEYEVQQGDSIWDLSMRFGAAVDEILSLNGLKEKDQIYPGDILKIPN